MPKEEDIKEPGGSKPSTSVTIVQNASVRMPGELQWSGNMSDNWKFFNQKFQIYLKASKNCLEETDFQVSLLLSIIGDRALKVYNNFSFSDTQDKNDIKDVLKKFEEYFMPEKNVTYERHKFFLRHQREGEGIDNYATDLRDLSSSCDFGQLTDSLIKDQIVLGIKDNTIKDRLLRIKDLDLSKAIEVCRASEQTKVQLAGICNYSKDEDSNLEIHKIKMRTGQHRSQDRQGSYRTDVGKPYYSNSNRDSTSPNNNTGKGPRPSAFKYVNKNKVQCKKCGYSHKPNCCPAYGKKCLKCHKIGHFASQCFHKSVNTLDETELCLGTINSVNKGTGKSNSVPSEWFANLLVNNFLNVKFKVDTGAQANVINTDVLDMLEIDRHNLVQTQTKLTSYTGQKLNILGKCTISCVYNNEQHSIEVFVISGKYPCILGLQSIVLFNIISTVNEIGYTDRPNCSEDVLKQFSDVFVGIGCLKGEYSIVLKDNFSPKIHAPRKVPFALQPKLKSKLNNLEKLGIVEKVNHPTDWVNSLTIVHKNDGDLRLCLDPKDLNEAIKRQHFQMPTFEDISSKLAGSTVFSILDTKDAFLHVKLSKESSDLCVFNTPYGRYKFNRLPYGLNLSSEVFQEKMSSLLEGMEGVSVYVDDILCYGVDLKQHNERLKKLLVKLRQENVKLNKNKCKFAINELKYLGHKISKAGIVPDDDKIKAITEMRAPTDKKELERFLGLVTYVGKFLPNLSDITTHLRELLKKDSYFLWTHEHDLAFNKLKTLISTKPVLQYFDISKPIVLSVDASSYALGAVILQNELPVAYASKALTTVQQSYSQIEKELLAVLFGCEKFYHYVYGKPFVVETDHKPLITIVKKNLVNCPPRLQRMLLRLQRFDFSLVYKKGTLMYVSDTLSRSCPNSIDTNPDPFLEECIEAQVCAVVDNINISTNQLSKVANLTDNDLELKTLKCYLLSEWPKEKKDLPEVIKQYWNIKDSLSYFKTKNLVLKGNAIVIPKCLRKEMLYRLHFTHSGISKTLLRAKDSIYWPNMYSQIVNMVNSCETCLTFSNANRKEPLIPHIVPRNPWEKVAIDLFQLYDKMYMLVVDYFSKYPEVVCLPSTTSQNVINVLKQVFSRHGIPEEVVTAHDVQFTSQMFKEFTENWEFKHVKTSPYFSQSNGMVERTIQSVKNILKKSKLEGTDPYLVLLEYRNTPIDSDLPSPAEILFSRKIRGFLPCHKSLLKPKLAKNVRFNLKNKQNRQKSYYDKKTRPRRQFKCNENVFIRKPDGSQWIKGKITKLNVNPRSYFVRNQAGRTYVRNKAHIKPIGDKHKSSDHNFVNLNDADNEPPRPIQSHDQCKAPNHSPKLLNRHTTQIKGTSEEINNSSPNKISPYESRPYSTRFGRNIVRPVKLNL